MSMTDFTRAPLAFVIGCALLGGSAARADDRLNSHPWDYGVHGNVAATGRAVTMWQAEQAGRPGGFLGGSTASGGGFGGLPSVGSVANMNLITVVVGDNSVVDVAVEAEQQNTGALSANATSVTATGGLVEVGAVASASTATQTAVRP